MSDIVKKMPDVPEFLQDVKVDLTRILKYETQVKDLVAVDINSGPMYMRDFDIAYSLTMTIVSKLDKLHEEAVINRKHEEAKAQLERAPKYFEKHEITNGTLKDSSSLRKTYVDLDDIVVTARKREAALKALLRYMSNKLDFFKMAHDDAKKIYDKTAGGPFGQTGYNNGPKSNS